MVCRFKHRIIEKSKFTNFLVKLKTKQHKRSFREGGLHDLNYFAYNGVMTKICRCSYAGFTEQESVLPGVHRHSHTFNILDISALHFINIAYKTTLSALTRRTPVLSFHNSSNNNKNNNT